MVLIRKGSYTIKENGNDIKKIQERLEKLIAEVRPVKRKAI